MLNFVHHNKFIIEYQQKNEDKFPNNGTDPGGRPTPDLSLFHGSSAGTSRVCWVGGENLVRNRWSVCSGIRARLRRFLENLRDEPVEADALAHGGQSQLAVKFGADPDIKAPL